MGSLTRVPGFINTLGQLRLVVPQAEAPPFGGPASSTAATGRPTTSRRHHEQPTPSSWPLERAASSRRPPRALRVCAPLQEDVMGRGYSEALIPKSWVRRGHSASYGRRSRHGVALLPPILGVTLDMQSPDPHDGLSVRPAGCGPSLAVTPQKTARARSVGPREGRPPAGGRPHPRSKGAIDLMRPGVATVISHQAAGL